MVIHRDAELLAKAVAASLAEWAPHERDPEAVLRDVREGKVSAARAREIYRVGTTPDETEALRA